MHLRKVLRWGACGLALGFGLASPAMADTTEELLKQLKAKGILSEQEYQALSARRAEEEKAKPAPAAMAAAPNDPSRLLQASDSGVGFKVGAVNVQISGSVNGFYVKDNADSPGPGKNVVGGLASVGGNDTSAIRNGLLPGFLKFDVTTRQGGWDVGAHFGIYPGINSVNWGGGANSAGQPTALTTSGIDFRQTYLTFAHAGFGEVKVGRDIGLFGSDAILSDITLLGVGTAAGNAAPSNTSLGRIGLGYIYTDFQPQITYTTPDFAGFKLSAGIFQPLATAGESELNDMPGFQAKATYDIKSGKVSGRLWAGVLSQDHDPAIAGGPDYKGTAFDAGAKLGIGDAGLLGYYYTGKGVGTTGLFVLSTDAKGNRRDSDGFYVQGTYKIDKVTLAASYGESHLDLAKGEVNPTLLSVNKSWVAATHYALTDWVTLVGEYINTKAEAHGGNKAKSDTIAIGAILFF